MSKTLAAKTRVSTFTKSALSLILASVVARAVSAHADVTLWYNGDYWGSGGGIANEIASNLGAHQVYDNFIVSGSTWNVDRIWCNNAMRLTGVTQASWEIRSGMAPGNGGTLVASGLSTATQTATGRAVGTMLEYTISVSGLNVQLAPGTYWLDVSPLVGNDPITGGALLSYASFTTGANAVGTPPGNDADGLWTCTGKGNPFESFGHDISMGVAGTVVPEPGSLALLLLGGATVLSSRRRASLR